MIGLLSNAQFWAVTDHQPLWVSPFDFLRVLVPVTIGNVLGGGALVALIYWFVYLQPARD
ncbi:hypothetical protein [Histidinibacterium aquaticum]|uniref:Formate transporter n=1 Tax=Histidinibacterium aquaticum TaxID=2613962 RepID=A0A5J5GC26_9RHOB|nr:hypothetical protein [Histidinibacterium aquaticum]KAA9004994.1 hypothetical protein F3S47_18995 [Histidinibacterium aquaticum]